MPTDATRGHLPTTRAAREKLRQAVLREKIAAASAAHDEWMAKSDERRVVVFRRLARRAAARSDAEWYAAVGRLYRAMRLWEAARRTGRRTDGGAGNAVAANPPSGSSAPPANVPGEPHA